MITAEVDLTTTNDDNTGMQVEEEVVETVEIPDQTASLTTSKRSIDDVAGEEELLTDIDSKRLKSEEV
ncbi:hypothetical protein E3Q17_01018 [Wallemia mellicola]|uniref:Uncharacterized protein n=1 Tax=Wallemia mellicola TaxID=1708541 RepID=A0A4T0LPH5_9BASI|nr:hypothetical protein E3Q24_02070 [Wallemia mellicola]TIC03029.1 hypothetical protein E3Q17_01018 [Wallemia mellicola]TIC45064.1 hypothetical protein E3Q08_01592 [Wallemia mellicola]